jgi:ABC-2 type transport system ATP-binding protein
MIDQIVISDVCKRFGRKVALDHVSFNVPAGVVFALLGENGAGKSTLLRGLLGYHRFDSGRIQVNGMDPTVQSLDIRRQVGYVADAPGLYEWMTVSQIGWYASGFYPEGSLRTMRICAQNLSCLAIPRSGISPKGCERKWHYPWRWHSIRSY